MEKKLKSFLFLSAFVTASFFMGCANTIPEDNASSTESRVEENAADNDTVNDYSRHCFGGHNGHVGSNGISAGHCSNRGGRSGRGRR